jgi:hypothetical protein
VAHDFDGELAGVLNQRFAGGDLWKWHDEIIAVSASCGGFGANFKTGYWVAPGFYV